MATFLDNLIPLKGRLNHSQLAGWQPAKVAEQGLGCRVEPAVMIPLPDGVRLEADIYLPKKQGKYPAIVQLAAYNKVMHTVGMPKGTNEVGSPPVITGRGYAQVILNTRGVGLSEGELGTFHNDQEVQDYLYCLEWVRRQPWCSGDICLFGTSYYGMIQPMVAGHQPEGLKAFFANEICTDFFRHLVYYGGAFNNEFFSLWIGANFKDKDITAGMPHWQRALLSHVVNHAWPWDYVMKRRIDQIYDYFIGQRVNDRTLAWFCQSMLDIKNYAECERLYSPGSYRQIPQIKTPFVVVQNLGMWNLHQFGSYDLFEHAATPAGQKFLILGRPEYELPVLAWQLEALAFFDWVVKGVDNGYENLPPVRYWLEGQNQYHPAGSFPLKQARRTRFYPNQGQALSLQPLPAGESASEQWAAIPYGAKILPGTDKILPPMLTYKFQAGQDIHLAGPITVNLQYSCNEMDSFVVCRLCREDLQNTLHILSMGALSPARRCINPALSNACEIAIDYGVVEPLRPNQIVTLRFSLTPSATFLKKNEKLVFQVASRSDLLKGALKDGYVHMNLTMPPYFARNTLHFGPDTFIELDMLD